MILNIFRAFRMLIALTILTGVVYPVLVTGLGTILYSKAANGSLIIKDEKIVGSKLLAQKFEGDKYFYPRPSSADYATVPTGASNLAPTSKVLKEEIEQRRQKYGEDAPVDLITASGSGLDPEISPEAALYQVDRISKARNLSAKDREKLLSLLDSSIELPTFGFIGKPRVNVLLLNIALDKINE